MDADTVRAGTIHGELRWGDNYREILYQEKIRLEDIVPAVGSDHVVEFWPGDVPRPGPVRLLWQPPESEVNGWTVSPIEILSCRVVDATALSVSGQRADIRVNRVIDLPTAFGRIPADEDFMSAQHMGRTGCRLNDWHGFEYTEVAAVGPYLYLHVVLGQSGTREAILEENSGRLTLLLHACRPPGTPTSEIMRYPLTDAEEVRYRFAIAAAKDIPVLPSTYLI